MPVGQAHRQGRRILAGVGSVHLMSRNLRCTIAEASARIIQNDGRTQDARVLREVVARFDQVAGPLEDHYGQVEQWKTLILGRP